MSPSPPVLSSLIAVLTRSKPISRDRHLEGEGDDGEEGGEEKKMREAEK